MMEWSTGTKTGYDVYEVYMEYGCVCQFNWQKSYQKGGFQL